MQTLQAYNSFQSSYSGIEFTIASIRTQCSCVGFVLSEIRNILSLHQNKPFHLDPGTRLREQFDFVLGACLVAFSILKARLDKLFGNDHDANRQLSIIEKLKLVGNQQEMKDLLQNIQGQAFAVNLLLSAFQTYVYSLCVSIPSLLSREKNVASGNTQSPCGECVQGHFEEGRR